MWFSFIKLHATESQKSLKEVCEGVAGVKWSTIWLKKFNEYHQLTSIIISYLCTYRGRWNKPAQCTYIVVTTDVILFTQKTLIKNSKILSTHAHAYRRIKSAHCYALFSEFFNEIQLILMLLTSKNLIKHSMNF